MSVLVVAFDGLDYNLIQNFSCSSLQQAEFGTIDNETGIHTRVTGELFASFITGELPEKHGIRGLKKWTNPGLAPYMEHIERFRYSGLLVSVLKSIRRLELEKRTYHQDDLPIPSLFEKIPKSQDIEVPAYTKQTLHDRIWTGLSLYNDLNLCDRDSKAEFEYRKKRLFEELHEPHDFLMCHFIRPDTVQHITTDMDDLEELYGEMDSLSEEILNSNHNYDTVIFMSDHGIPEGDEHNTRAFYSSNRELFDDTPHITDFHDKILSLIDPANETPGIDI